MSRQHSAIASADLQLLSHTAPTSSFQVFTREQARNRKWCAYTGCGIKSFYLGKLPDQLSVVQNNTSDLLMLFFFQESQRPHENNRIPDTYCVCALSSKMCSIPNRRPHTVRAWCGIKWPSWKGSSANEQTASHFCNIWLDTSVVEIWETDNW